MSPAAVWKDFPLAEYAVGHWLIMPGSRTCREMSRMGRNNYLTRANHISQDVCSRDSTDNATLLHLASRDGPAKAACKHIERGTDATAQNNEGETPLHLTQERSHVY
jgi:ankyrin repeat protein